MEKILLAIDGYNLNHQALDFACYLAGMEHASITGVFLENLVASHSKQMALHSLVPLLSIHE